MSEKFDKSTDEQVRSLFDLDRSSRLEVAALENARRSLAAETTSGAGSPPRATRWLALAAAIVFAAAAAVAALQLRGGSQIAEPPSSAEARPLAQAIETTVATASEPIAPDPAASDPTSQVLRFSNGLVIEVLHIRQGQTSQLHWIVTRTDRPVLLQANGGLAYSLGSGTIDNVTGSIVPAELSTACQDGSVVYTTPASGSGVVAAVVLVADDSAPEVQTATQGEAKAYGNGVVVAPVTGCAVAIRGAP